MVGELALGRAAMIGSGNCKRKTLMPTVSSPLRSQTTMNIEMDYMIDATHVKPH
jgi:hypothetical protein